MEEFQHYRLYSVNDETIQAFQGRPLSDYLKLPEPNEDVDIRHKENDNIHVNSAGLFKVVEAIYRMSKEKGRAYGFWIHGLPGTGKTHSATYYTLRCQQDLGYKPVLVETDDLYWAANYVDHRVEDGEKVLLVLDDLFNDAYLLNDSEEGIVNFSKLIIKAYAKGIPIIVTSNFSLEQMARAAVNAKNGEKRAIAFVLEALTGGESYRKLEDAFTLQNMEAVLSRGKELMPFRIFVNDIDYREATKGYLNGQLKSYLK